MIKFLLPRLSIRGFSHTLHAAVEAYDDAASTNVVRAMPSGGNLPSWRAMM
jgi:hypothetical protein